MVDTKEVCLSLLFFEDFVKSTLLQEIVNPLENAIETVEVQTARLEEEMSPGGDHNQLQMLLQGSVRLRAYPDVVVVETNADVVFV